MTARSPSPRARRLVADLGYELTDGFAWSDGFAALGSHRAALDAAAARMNVVAVFGLRPANERRRFKPLVLIAEADDEPGVRELHRRAWSQGLAPYLLVLTPDQLWRCDGFDFSADPGDRRTRTTIAWDDEAVTHRSSTVHPDLRRLHAQALRSRITWRDYAISEAGVDKILLDNLAQLSDDLSQGLSGLPVLPIDVAHALIGRMIYIYILVDRGILDAAWFAHRTLDRRVIAQSNVPWPVVDFLALNARLDTVFNGTIFPWEGGVDAITAEHIAFLRDAIRLGRASGHGSVQLALFEIDLGSIRIETLSAVYELFLTKTDPVKKKTDGIFYTRPYLADFMLDAVEDHQPLTDSVRVLDPACGSGVFLVGAYRRKIENALAREGRAALPAARLRTLLLEGIYGAELRPQASYVTAFSLYLTLLDYLAPDELADYALGRRAPDDKLFPPLVGRNILPDDFFVSQDGFTDRFDVVVGNPPWGNALNSEVPGLIAAAKRWQTKVENAQAAQIFVLETLESHLAPAGIALYLLPAGSIGNDQAIKFRRAVLEHRVLSVTNLAPFRREMFMETEQAAAILTIQKTTADRRADDAHLVRFDAPTAISQPVKKKTSAWTLVLDPAESCNIAQARLHDDTVWIRSINGRSVDHDIMDYVDTRVKRGRFATLGSLQPALTFKLGAEERYSGVPEAYTLTTAKKGGVHYLTLKEPAHRLQLDRADAPYALPDEIQARIKGKYQALFRENVILIPRAGGEALRADRPVAFNTTLTGIRLAEPGHTGETLLLDAVVHVLNSRWARYYLSLHAPSAFNDRPRLSLPDLRALPIPFNGPDDPRLGQFVSAAQENPQDCSFAFLGIDGDYRAAIDEFLDYRCLFANANVPDEAFAEPATSEQTDYVRTVRKRLVGVAGDGFEVRLIDRVRNLILVGTTLDPRSEPSQFDLTPALQAYDHEGMAGFENSLFVWRDPNTARLVLAKPTERHHWTIAQAFTDAERVAAEILQS